MVGVVGSSPIVPTNVHKCRAGQHGIFFAGARRWCLLFFAYEVIVAASGCGTCPVNGARGMAFMSCGASPFFGFGCAFFVLLC